MHGMMYEAVVKVIEPVEVIFSAVASNAAEAIEKAAEKAFNAGAELVTILLVVEVI